MNPIKSTIDYVRSSVAELKKVTWPTKEMTLRYTAAVIIVCVSLAAFFAVLDFSFSKLITAALTQRTANAPVSVEEQPVVPDIQPISATATTPNENGNLQLDLNSSSTSAQ
jgi:preprotein translocase SecE subunit